MPITTNSFTKIPKRKSHQWKPEITSTSKWPNHYSWLKVIFSLTLFTKIINMKIRWYVDLECIQVSCWRVRDIKEPSMFNLINIVLIQIAFIKMMVTSTQISRWWCCLIKDVKMRNVTMLVLKNINIVRIARVRWVNKLRTGNKSTPSSISEKKIEWMSSNTEENNNLVTKKTTTLKHATMELMKKSTEDINILKKSKKIARPWTAVSTDQQQKILAKMTLKSTKNMNAKTVIVRKCMHTFKKKMRRNLNRLYISNISNKKEKMRKRRIKTYDRRNN